MKRERDAAKMQKTQIRAVNKQTYGFLASLQALEDQYTEDLNKGLEKEKQRRHEESLVEDKLTEEVEVVKTQGGEVREESKHQRTEEIGQEQEHEQKQEQVKEKEKREDKGKGKEPEIEKEEKLLPNDSDELEKKRECCISTSLSFLPISFINMRYLRPILR